MERLWLFDPLCTGWQVRVTALHLRGNFVSQAAELSVDLLGAFESCRNVRKNIFSSNVFDDLRLMKQALRPGELLPRDGFGDELAVGEIHLEFLALGALDDLDAMRADRQGHIHRRFLGMFASVDHDGQPGRIC